MPFNQKKQKRVDRTDKWYVLAKEQGYRSRAAFKLSHINKEFNLISKQTRVVLDLCAAPGGWSQVAAKEAGAGCAVIAVDLLPIRPIPNVRTIVGDITLDRTHAIVRKEAKESMQRQDDEEGRAVDTWTSCYVMVRRTWAPRIRRTPSSRTRFPC